MPRSDPRPLHQDDDTLLRERVKPRARPPRYQVVMLNDDFTPMEFVVDVLEVVFQMPKPQAVHVMLQVHHHDRGICGVYSFDVAESKVRDVLNYARQNQHPLLCHVEAVSDSKDKGDDDA